ncbi:hypothetical protein GLOIN_2v1774909 [Rhizophagus irregularis DAOM 181602=DAOM 197198]|nr:hypothetical protein GLOIN_2v1774909 [Rhizophagus irregularis DAOM 181602=DAOM 197198]
MSIIYSVSSKENAPEFVNSDKLKLWKGIEDHCPEKRPKNKSVHILVDSPVSTTISSREQTLLDEVASLRALVKSVYDFDVVVSPKWHKNDRKYQTCNPPKPQSRYTDDLNPSIDVYPTSSCDCADTKNEKHKEALRKLLITNLHYNISHRCNLRGQKKYQFIFLSRLCNLPSSKDNTEEADRGKNRHGNLDYGIESRKTLFIAYKDMTRRENKRMALSHKNRLEFTVRS